MNDVTHEGVRAQMWAMSRIRVSHVIDTKDIWIYVTCIMNDIRYHALRSQDSDVYELCHTYGWVMTSTRRMYVTCLINESRHTCGWDVSYIWTSHVTHTKDICYMPHDCITLQHAVTHCSTLHHTATHCNTLQHTATHCNTLQHTATHCNTLQHTATNKVCTRSFKSLHNSI